MMKIWKINKKKITLQILKILCKNTIKKPNKFSECFQENYLYIKINKKIKYNLRNKKLTKGFKNIWRF